MEKNTKTKQATSGSLFDFLYITNKDRKQSVVLESHIIFNEQLLG